MGSFIGLVCDRFPEQSIITPRSHCNSCGHQLGVWELIPILSQILLSSRCSSCHMRVPLRYLAIEVFSGLLLVLCTWNILSIWQSYFLLFSLCLSLFDLKSKSFPLGVFLFGGLPFICLGQFNLLCLIFLLSALLAYLKQYPIGEGDLLYLAIASLLYPYQDLLLAIEIACLLGISCYITQKSKQMAIPFLPFLSLGFFIVTLFI